MMQLGSHFDRTEFLRGESTCLNLPFNRVGGKKGTNEQNEMLELQKGVFGDGVAIACLRELSLDHYGDHHNQAPFFHGSAYAVKYKPPHQERQTIVGMSTHPPVSPSDSEGCLRHTANFLPFESSTCHLSCAPSYNQPHQLEVQDTDTCSTWMSDFLDDFPAIGAAELPPLVPTDSSNFNRIPRTELTCIESLSISQQHTAELSLEAKSGAPEPQLTIRPTTIESDQRVSNQRAPIPDNVLFLSPTPKPLKPRVSRRSRFKVAVNSKKVPNVEKLEHVERERQRRDDMSFKISTLGCLLPPAVPKLKRDKSSIVHDSIHYLKSLQEKVEVLRKTMAELKLDQSRRTAQRSDNVKVGNPEIASSSSKAQFVEYHVQVEGEGQPAAILEKSRCRPDFMSSAMEVLEHLNLDVCRCTITKPRLNSNQVATSASVVRALKASLQLL